MNYKGQMLNIIECLIIEMILKFSFLQGLYISKQKLTWLDSICQNTKIVLKSWFFKNFFFIFSIGKWSYITLQCSSFIKTTLYAVSHHCTVITFTNRNQSDHLKALKNSHRDCQGIKKWRKQFFHFYPNLKILLLANFTYKPG